MQPWMILALLIGAGFATLLVAPTIHRRINERSRREVHASRMARASSLRDEGAASRRFTTSSSCVRVRDRLLLRGVRAEMLEEAHEFHLVFDPAHSEIVDGVIAELGTE